MSKKQTAETRQIEELLRERFEDVKAYRRNSASIRVRVIDDKFKGKSLLKREAMVQPVIRKLPEDIQSDIMMLLLLTDDEREESHLNLEFERPSPSRL